MQNPLDKLARYPAIAWLALLAGIFLTLYSATVLTGSAMESIRLIKALTQYQRVEARVVSGGVEKTGLAIPGVPDIFPGYAPVIAYEYVADGKTRSAVTHRDKGAYFTPYNAQKIIDDHPPGSILIASIRPGYPEEVYLQTEIVSIVDRLFYMLIPPFAGLGFFFLGLVLLIRQRKQARRAV